MIKLSDEDYAYLAGIIDGEGSIIIRTVYHNKTSVYLVPSLIISNTDMNLMNYIRERFPLKTRSLTKDKRKHKIVYQAVITCKKTLKPFLEKIYPFLIVKKKQAELLLNFMESRGDKWNTLPPKERGYTKKEIEIFWRIRRINCTDKVLKRNALKIKRRKKNEVIFKYIPKDIKKVIG